ncbi:AraC family transcriptional regulator [Bradyrhizobium guangdongense]
MTSPNSPFSPVAISTEAFAPQQRLTKWREIYGHNIAKVDIETIGDDPFHASVKFQGLPGIELVSGSRSAAHYRIERQHLIGARDGFGLSVLLSGGATTRQLGRENVLSPGTAVVISGTDPSVNTMHNLGKFLTIVLPRPRLSGLVKDLDSAYARQIPAENAALRLLIRYVDTLHQDVAFTDAAFAQVVANHIIDLSALAIGAGEDVAYEARHGGVAAARLQAIKTDIRSNLGDHALSPAKIAAQHGLTPRYLHKLFEREGMSFSEFVLARRLERALEMLKDPHFAGYTVSTIAFDCGFSDLSYFNRTFRRAYGATPTDIRAATFRMR